MIQTIECQLLMPASQDYVFRFYLDCYHWNVWFNGIEQSWLEQEARVGAHGKVILNSSGSWKMRIVSLHDDSECVIRCKKLFLTATFEVQTRHIRNEFTQVVHTVRLKGISGFLCALLWRRRIRNWLQENLQTLCEYVEQHKQEHKQQRKKTTRKRKKST